MSERISRRGFLKLAVFGGAATALATAVGLRPQQEARASFIGQGKDGEFAGFKVESAGIGNLMSLDMTALRSTIGDKAADGVLANTRTALTLQGKRSSDYTIYQSVLTLNGEKGKVLLPMIHCKPTATDKPSVRFAVMGINAVGNIHAPSVGDMENANNRSLVAISLDKQVPAIGGATIRSNAEIVFAQVGGSRDWSFTAPKMFPDLAAGHVADYAPLGSNASKDAFFQI